MLAIELEYSLDINIIWGYLINHKKYSNNAIFLDSNFFHKKYGVNSYIVFDPVKTFIYNYSDNNLDDFLNKLNYELEVNYIKNNQFDFIGGLAGFISYDLADNLERIRLPEKNNIPKIYFGLYDKVIIYNHKLKKIYLIASSIKSISNDLALTTKMNYLKQIIKNAFDYFYKKYQLKFTKIPSLTITSNFSKDEYINAVKKIIEYIKNGDVFEVNLSQKFKAILNKSFPQKKLYNFLRDKNKAPFSANITLNNLQILSFSPERFIKIKNNYIVTCPIKGTIKRDNDFIEDKFLANILHNSEKDRAENIMIVDLMRNDLSKICEKTSVKVSELCKIESFTNVHHLVSTIKGKLKSSIKNTDIIKTCFPGGSITGAPKIRAMEIISEIEKSNRNIYCGSIGYFSFNNIADLSIAIRTVIINDNELHLSAGGAITLDSNPESEYQETILKAEKIISILSNLDPIL